MPGAPVRVPAAVLGPVANTDVELPRRPARPRRGCEPVQHLSNILQSADAGSDQWARLLQTPGPRIRVAVKRMTELSMAAARAAASAVSASKQTAYPAIGSRLAILQLWPPVSRCAGTAELNQVNPGLRPHSAMALRAGLHSTSVACTRLTTSRSGGQFPPPAVAPPAIPNRWRARESRSTHGRREAPFQMGLNPACGWPPVLSTIRLRALVKAT